MHNFYFLTTFWEYTQNKKACGADRQLKLTTDTPQAGSKTRLRTPKNPAEKPGERPGIAV